jgi:hypothetical protein
LPGGFHRLRATFMALRPSLRYRLFNGLNTRAIAGVVAAMGEEDFAVGVEQQIAARLIDVVAAIVLEVMAFSQQVPIEPEHSGLEQPPQTEPFQLRSAIERTLRVSQDGDRPVESLLVSLQHLRLGERDHDHRHTAFREPALDADHLPEVVLTGQSGQMTQTDHEREPLELFPERNRGSVRVGQAKFSEIDSFHPDCL